MICLLAGATIFSKPVCGQEILSELEERVIHYEAEGLNDPIALLQKRLDKGQTKLRFQKGRGYLDSVLKELQVPASSQCLVFSKTSSQRDQTSPRTPRALYFADNVSIGWVPESSVIDFAAIDPVRGPIFYTLEQRADTPPKFSRRNDCMQCHLGPKTINVPGLVVRSFYTASDGVPLGQVDEFVSGHNSALQERWGGWYVSGTHAGEFHQGNLFATNVEHPERLDLSAGANVLDLKNRFDSSRYLSAHSDIVALLVLEHLVRMQNLITRANYETRYALADLAAANHSTATSGSTNEAPASRPVNDWPHQRIALAGEMLLEYMLFRNEAPLKGAVKGTSDFTSQFQRAGVRDSKGRSFHQLDLEHRLLRYPCSFLIYSAAFDALPSEMKDFLWRRLDQILTGKDLTPTYAAMAPIDRQNVFEILKATKPEFAQWLNR